MIYSDVHLLDSSQIQRVLNEIGKKIEQSENTIQKLREENNALKSEHYKDEELARLKQAKDDLWEEYLNSFSLSDRDRQKLNHLFEEHCLQHPDESNSLASAVHCPELGENVYRMIKCKYPRHRIVSYTFYPTEVDTFIKAECNCGEVFDIY